MMWLGDNWYTREVDYSSPWGLWYEGEQGKGIACNERFIQEHAQLCHLG